MKKIFKIISKILGNKRYNIFMTKISRLINKKMDREWVCKEKEEYTVIKNKGRNISFGYYDYNPIKNEKVLFMEFKDNIKNFAKIYFYNLETKEKNYIASTKAFSLQMGSRLNWFSNNEVIFNDYDKKTGYLSRVVTIGGKETKRFDFPIYDLDKDKENAYYLNFDILQYYRKGYGYDNNPIKKDTENINGIFKGNLKNNQKELLLSIENIKKYKSEILEESSNHYINHISCSPFDDKVLFFHLWTKDDELKNRVFIIDKTGKVLDIIDNFDRASHYAWKSKNEILLTVLMNKQIKYILYNIETKQNKVLDFLTIDGHPTYINKDYFITDTYPDQNGMQHIFLCNEYSIVNELVEIYHNPRKIQEYRCDLHPRYGDGILTFDSIKGKNRCENILKINLEKIINKEEYIKDKRKNKRGIEIYKFLYKKICPNLLKVLYAKKFDFKYQAHLLVDKMLNSKSEFKKNIYFNKLQREYSMWISPKCKIGKNIHFMHLDGVTIGSGVIIGDNCTIYQQVTLGKEKEKFPIIGNNVTIYSGAKVIGNVKVGNNAIIGANAVVTKDVPDNCVAVGIPARIIKKD